MTTAMNKRAVLTVITPPRFGAAHCDQFVCLCVCVSVCPRAYLWSRWTELHEFFCAYSLWPWLGPPLAALQYVMYFRFYG